MAQKVCPPDCRDAPFDHIEVRTRSGVKFILCLLCRHYWGRPRGNCKCPEMCHISDMIDAVS